MDHSAASMLAPNQTSNIKRTEPHSKKKGKASSNILYKQSEAHSREK